MRQAPCASPYQEKGLAGGYSETRLSENVFQINFKGNGYTDRERSSDFSLLRSAEVAIDNGYNYFEIVNHENNENNSFYTTPVTVQTTGYANTYGNTSGSINTFGNNANYRGNYNGTAFGNSATTISGDNTYKISNPETTNTIVCYKNKPKANNFIFDANLIRNSLRSKYKLPLLNEAKS